MWLLTPALAGDVFLSVSDPVRLDVGGMWPRAFARDGGAFWLLNAANGEYYVRPADEALAPDNQAVRALTGRTNLQDHAVARCPDGTWLHVASASVVTNDDSLYVFRYDRDWNLVGSATIAEGEGEYRHNDMPVVCGSTFVGAARTHWESGMLQLLSIAPDLSASRHDLSSKGPISLGSALFERDQELVVLGAPAKDRIGGLLDTYDVAFQRLGAETVPLVEEPWSPSWTQAIVAYQRAMLVVHLAYDTSREWNEQVGDLWVTAYDRDMQVIDQVQLTNNEPPNGGRQPGMVLDGSRLLAFYSVDQVNYAWELTLGDLTAGTTDEPVIQPDLDPARPETVIGASDSGTPIDPVELEATPSETCGCRGGAAALLPILPLLALRRRGRR